MYISSTDLHNSFEKEDTIPILKQRFSCETEAEGSQVKR